MEEHEELTGGELVYRIAAPEQLRYVEEDGSAPVLEGRMMPYDEWTEIDSSVEGHFMERFAPGALAKTMAEQGSRVRALFEHGMDVALGRQAIAADIELRDEPDGAYFRAALLDGLPQLLLSGLRSGVYGSSVRYRPVKATRERYPAPSESNPDGLPEVTVREAHLKEFSVTPFPAYAGATATVRSITDEIAAKQLMKDPQRLLEIIAAGTGGATGTAGSSTNFTWTPGTGPSQTITEPQHSRPAEAGSRSTRPTRDYLKPSKEDTPWRL